MTEEASNRLFERHTIRPVPLTDRHGSGRGLFGIWLGINMLPLTVVTGALATAIFGLTFWWSLVAIVVGNVVGGVFMALHAVQGPRLGVPQMLQARGQFGAHGAALIVAIALIMFLGFFVSNLVVGAQALHEVIAAIDVTTGIVLATTISLLISIIGLRVIKAFVTAWALVIGLLTVVCFGWLAVTGLPGDALGTGAFTAVGFFSTVAIGAVWQAAYAPYVSDYSRYLPAGTGARGAFWGTYGGSVLSSVLMMTLGALIGAAVPNAEPMAGLTTVMGGFGPFVLLSFALASASTNAGNIYCAMLNALTLGETLRKGWRPAARSRVTATVILHVTGLAIAVLGQGDFLVNFKNFILLLLYVLVPWSAINLVDYFAVQHGSYDVDDFFATDGGKYGYWNWTALAVYVLGLVAQVPFAVTAFYTGPLAVQLAGVDVAWIVGLAVSGGVYYLVARKKPVPPVADRTADSATAPAKSAPVAGA